MFENNQAIKISGSEDLKNKIYNIRGCQVMLDRDLAVLYGVKAIALRQQIKRNIKRFPLDFMFELTEEEVDLLVSHFVIPSKKYLGGALPIVFTEQGIANISSVLNSEKAIEVNIKIMRAFVEMRKFLNTNALLFQRLDNVEKKQIEYDIKFDKIFNALENKENTPKQGIFFDGQIFDAYKFVADLIRKATKSIVIIDNFVDERVFALLSKRQKNVEVTIFTKKISEELLIDLEKYNSQYPKIEIKILQKSHDRFLILDDEEVYLIGASLKDLGTKWFGFSKIELESFKIIEKLKEVKIK